LSEEPVARFWNSRPTLLLEQFTPMIWVFDALCFAEASLVQRNDAISIKQTHLRCVNPLQ
jgi:hypothetical protein